MDESVLFNGVMRAVLGGRRRRGRRAMGYVGSAVGTAGSALLSNPTALLTAAGVAWGIFETLQGGGQGQTATTGGAGLNTSGAGFGTAGSAPAQAASMPPLPTVGASVAAPMSDATRMVRLALSAAQADGALGPQERETVLARAREAGMADLVEQELQQQRPLSEIVGGVNDPAQRATLYNLAFAVVRADEQVGGAERIYLAQLANLLGLDPASVQRLESAAAAKIDAAPEA
jgi:uncharacterized membrane protein YebE (DUF533 family)